MRLPILSSYVGTHQQRLISAQWCIGIYAINLFCTLDGTNIQPHFTPLHQVQMVVHVLDYRYTCQCYSIIEMFNYIYAGILYS